MFFGASLDQIAAGVSLGISTVNSIPYTASPVGIKSLYHSVSENVTSYRSK